MPGTSGDNGLSFHTALDLAHRRYVVEGRVLKSEDKVNASAGPLKPPSSYILKHLSHIRVNVHYVEARCVA